MAATIFKMAPLGLAPRGQRPQVRRAQRYLTATHASVSGLLDAFNLVRGQAAFERGTAAGRLRSDQVDLLRAVLVFTSSGLDATCHALVRDCAPRLIRRGGTTARLKFNLFLDEQVKTASAEFTAAIKDPDPRSILIELYVRERTRASYQGTGDLIKRVRDVLGIPNSRISKTRIEALNGFFTAHNSIVHALDYADPASTSTLRVHRSPGDVVAECDTVLRLMSDLIHETAAQV